AHHHAQRGVPGPDQGPEVLAGQVRGERLVLVVAPGGDAAAARALLGLDGGADRDELRDVRADLLQLPAQPAPPPALPAPPPSGPWPARGRGTWPATARRVPGSCPPGRTAAPRGRSSCPAPARAAGTPPRGPAGTH